MTFYAALKGRNAGCNIFPSAARVCVLTFYAALKGRNASCNNFSSAETSIGDPDLLKRKCGFCILTGRLIFCSFLIISKTDLS